MVEQVLGDIDTCKKEVSGFDDHNGSSICILGKDNLEKGTCYWDQGYGLYTEKDDRYYLHGFMGANSLVSEKTCGTKDAKTVYINVLNKMDFIKDNCYLTERYLTDATVV
ncbi:hypothetical protein GGF39_001480 [Coemansia sp. RSA 1721]|nr:hypothetical protein GGF39_001480 [Coemansia sp. RSA 1721]